MITVGIGEDIFKEFFKKLGEDDEFPQLITKELRNLWKNGEIISQEKILEAIKKGCEDGGEN